VIARKEHRNQPMGKTLRALGLMSGTSMDGIDVALIETDGEDTLQRGRSGTYPYSETFRANLREALAQAAQIGQRRERPAQLAMVEQYLTDLHVEAVTQFLEDHRVDPQTVDVIGFHGQTVLHKTVMTRSTSVDEPKAVLDTPPVSAAIGPRTLTVQLGDGARLAKQTGIDVVYDLRAADCAAGGQGAPLAPVYHRALTARLPDRPVALLNIGGVANVTWIGAKGELLAFDTGPGNAMIDDWMQRRLGFPRDEDGALAGKGRVHENYLTEYLRHSYFGQPPPKSLDRNAFSPWLVHALSPEDGAATLTAFSATSIARAREHFPEQPKLWLIAGGGRRNRTLMGMIAERVEAAVAPAEAAGIDGDSLEAEAWAYMAVRSLAGLPISFPGTTGAPRPMTGGVLARA
jgi:anhydro-N-acetylmuramic acid kinase